MSAQRVKLTSQISQLCQLLVTSPDNLISLMKERIDQGRAMEAVLLGQPIPIRDEADDDQITQDDIDWCMEKLKFLLQPENRNPYVRIKNSQH